MKYLLTTMCALVFTFTMAFGQAKHKKFAAIETEKIAYITKEMNLTPAEAQKFFPIYNQYNSEMWDIKSERRGGAATPAGVSSFNAPAKRDVIAYDAQEVELKKQYRKKFADVVGQSRASQFFEVEQRFTDLLIKRIQK